MTEAKKNPLKEYAVAVADLSGDGKNKLRELEETEQRELESTLYKEKLKRRIADAKMGVNPSILPPSIPMVQTQGGYQAVQTGQQLLETILKDETAYQRWISMTPEQKQEFLSYANMASGQQRPDAMLQYMMWQQLMNKSQGQQMSFKETMELSLKMVETAIAAAKGSGGGGVEIWNSAMQTLTPLIQRLGDTEKGALVNEIKALVQSQQTGLDLLTKFKDLGLIQLGQQNLSPEVQLQLKQMDIDERRFEINQRWQMMKERQDRQSKESEKEWIFELLGPLVDQAGPLIKSFGKGFAERVATGGTMQPQYQPPAIPQTTGFPCQSCGRNFPIAEPMPDMFACPWCGATHSKYGAKLPEGAQIAPPATAAPPPSMDLIDKWVGRGAGTAATTT